MRHRLAQSTCQRAQAVRILLVWPARWVVILAALAGIYDLFIAQALPDQLDKKFPKLVEIAPEWSWQTWTMIILAVLLVAVFEKAHRQLAALQHPKRQPPKNRDALISAFTELGQRATNVTNARQLADTMSYITDTYRTKEQIQKIDEARTLYREALLATDKEINIAGGDLSRVLRLQKTLISMRLTEDRAEAEGLDPSGSPEPPSIQESVKKAIAEVNLGPWSTEN